MFCSSSQDQGLAFRVDGCVLSNDCSESLQDRVDDRNQRVEEVHPLINEVFRNRRLRQTSDATSPESGEVPVTSRHATGLFGTRRISRETSELHDSFLPIIFLRRKPREAGPVAGALQIFNQAVWA